ncbi:MAG: DUF2341 domain-containing protein [Chitinispirillaceae bacterium]|nr:DUF2341 domain-containing protein [Chitinispirillaceae bacterium]
MKIKNRNSVVRIAGALFVAVTGAALISGCADINIAGGGSDTEVSGHIVAVTGEEVTGAIVALIDTGYDPATDGALLPGRFDTTDKAGQYHFDSLQPGAYNVWAMNPADSTQILVNAVSVIAQRETRVGDQVLRAAAFLRFLLPDSLAATPGIISIPGTILQKQTTGMDALAELSGVPLGILSSIRFRATQPEPPIVLFSDIIVKSSDTLTLNVENEISGRIMQAGSPAAGVHVTLVPATHNPHFDSVLHSSLSATTTTDGTYRLYNISQGSYNLHAASGDRIFRTGITINSQRVITIPDAAILGTATLVVPLPDSLQALAGHVYMPGTMRSAQTVAGATSVTFDSLAQGVYGSIVYQQSSAHPAIVLFTNVVIDSAGVFVLDPYAAWQNAAQMTLNTTSTGANVGQNVYGFPVLVRLTAVEIDFSQARKEGEDLLLARPDNSLLSFEIEYWDSATSSAVVWVRIDTVFGNASTPACRIYWGNPAARKTSVPSLVFRTTEGFQGVWHFGEAGGDEKNDATANGYTGTPTEMDGSSDVSAVAGRGLDFDGSSQCVSVLNARNTSLDVQADSFYTVSAWVYGRNVQRDNRVIVSKGSAQYGLRMNERNQWEFYGGLRGYGVDTTTSSPATINVWTHLTGVRRGMRQYLYVNGMLADSTAAAAGVSASISNNFYDLTIGRQSDDESQWFDGMIDEVRVENRARNEAWIRLLYENQRSGQRFVQIQKVR